MLPAREVEASIEVVVPVPDAPLAGRVERPQVGLPARDKSRKYSLQIYFYGTTSLVKARLLICPIKCLRRSDWRGTLTVWQNRASYATAQYKNHKEP